MADEDWGQLADEQEKKLQSTVCYSNTRICVLMMIKEWITWISNLCSGHAYCLHWISVFFHKRQSYLVCRQSDRTQLTVIVKKLGLAIAER